MSAKLTVMRNGAIIAAIGAPGWARKFLNTRAQVICARAQLRALEVENEDAADAINRVLTAVANDLEDLAAELECKQQVPS